MALENSDGLFGFPKSKTVQVMGHIQAHVARRSRSGGLVEQH